MLREGLFDHHRRDSIPLLVAAAGGQPLAQALYGPVPEGYAWYIELAGFLVVGNSHTAAAILAASPDNTNVPSLAAWDGAGLQAQVPAATSGAWSLPLPMYLGPGHWARVLLAGGTLANGDAATATFQTAVHQLDPRYMMSPEDTAQVKRAHERAEAELNLDAVGQRAV